MKCPKCGTENKDGSKYCKNCGYELLKENKKLPVGRIIGIVVIIAIALFIVYWNSSIGIWNRKYGQGTEPQVDSAMKYYFDNRESFNKFELAMMKKRLMPMAEGMVKHYIEGNSYFDYEEIIDDLIELRDIPVMTDEINALIDKINSFEASKGNAIKAPEDNAADIKVSDSINNDSEYGPGLGDPVEYEDWAGDYDENNPPFVPSNISNDFGVDYIEGEQNIWALSQNEETYQSNWRYFKKQDTSEYYCNSLFKQKIDSDIPEKIGIDVAWRDFAVLGRWIYCRSYDDYDNPNTGVVQSIQRVSTDGRDMRIYVTENRMIDYGFCAYKDYLYYIKRTNTSATSYTKSLCCLDTNKGIIIYEGEAIPGEERIELIGIYNSKFYIMIGDTIKYINADNPNGELINLISIANDSSFPGFSYDPGGLPDHARYCKGYICGKYFVYDYSYGVVLTQTRQVRIVDLEAGTIKSSSFDEPGYEGIKKCFEVPGYGPCAFVLNEEYISMGNSNYTLKMIPIDEFVENGYRYNDIVTEKDEIFPQYVYNNYLYYVSNKRVCRIKLDGSDWSEIRAYDW